MGTISLSSDAAGRRPRFLRRAALRRLALVRPVTRPGRVISAPSVLVVVVVLVVTAAMSWAAHRVTDRTESRLLKLKVAETGSVLQALVPGVETPLRSAAEITNASGGEVAAFDDYMGDLVGPQRPFVAASLWRISPGPPRLVSSLGRPLLLQQRPASVPDVFAKAVAATGVSVSSYLQGPDRRLGYALTTAVPDTSLAVYAESALPPTTRVTLPPDGPFSDLLFQLHLGDATGPLLYGDTDRLPSRHSSTTVGFGDTSLTLVGALSRPASGRLATALWWIVLVLGAALAVVSGATTERISRGREQARDLAARLDESLAEQRRNSSQLQHALLPRIPSDLAGVEVAAEYVAASGGLELGGDWYDVVAVDDGRLFFTVGDVSGRGLAAGAVMARLQYAARALAHIDPDPAAVLRGLTRLVDLVRDGHFATVLCGLVDVGASRLTLATAGHLPPMLVGAAGARLLSVPPGPPIGVGSPGAYRNAVHDLPPDATVVAYTDGLVERRGEDIDVSLQRLLDLAGRTSGSPADLVADLVTARATADDDTAVIAFRWQPSMADAAPPTA